MEEGERQRSDMAAYFRLFTGNSVFRKMILGEVWSLACVETTVLVTAAITVHAPALRDSRPAADVARTLTVHPIQRWLPF